MTKQPYNLTWINNNKVERIPNQNRPGTAPLPNLDEFVQSNRRSAIKALRADPRSEIAGTFLGSAKVAVISDCA